jgi:hypothetical protein
VCHPNLTISDETQTTSKLDSKAANLQKIKGATGSWHSNQLNYSRSTGSLWNIDVLNGFDGCDLPRAGNTELKIGNTVRLTKPDNESKLQEGV